MNLLDPGVGFSIFSTVHEPYQLAEFGFAPQPHVLVYCMLLLLQEITRRVNLQDIWQAAYTAGIVLPKPVAQCR